MTGTCRVLLSFVGSLVVLGICGPALGKTPESKLPPRIGPVPIRFYSGNASVARFMHYQGTRKDGNQDPITPAQIEQLKRCSCRAMCDYIAWCTVEQEPGVWDWSFYRRNAEMLEAAGLEYNVFCWLHFPPRWFLNSDRFVGYEDLATGETIPQMSLWSPEALKLYDEFYERLAKALGDKIAFIRLAMPSEYGEIGYCTGMTKWLVPQEHARPAYWCGDRHAREHFAGRMLERYTSLDALNRAWATQFSSAGDIQMPDVSQPMAQLVDASPGRTHWLDFMEWYQQSWTDFMIDAVTVTRQHFPDREMIISLGYAAEAGRYGNDQGRHIKAMSGLNVAAQTPGAIGYFAARRVSTACRVYGVSYFTEPPGSVSREQQVLRIWMDASNGTQTWFDYLPNMDRARDLFVRYKKHLTGQPPVCDLGLWLPTWHHYLNPDENWPRQLEAVAGELRELCDYEILDDHMIADGGLERLNIRVLVLADADYLSVAAVNAVRRWVEGGGVFITFQSDPVEMRGDDGGTWRTLIGTPVTTQGLTSVSVAAPVPPAYRFSAVDSSAAPYLTGKWFGTDGAGPDAIHWCGEDGGLRLPVEPGQAYRVILGLGLPAWAGNVRVRVADAVLGNIQPGKETVALDLPAAMTADRSFVDLRFEGKTWRPSEVQGTDDRRELLISIGTVEVRRKEFTEATASSPPPIQREWQWNRIWTECGRALGEGRVLVIPEVEHSAADQADLIAHFNHQLSRYGPYADAPQIDGQRDEVWATLLPDRVLYYSHAQQTVRREVEIPAVRIESKARAGTPARRMLRIGPGQIASLVRMKPAAP